MHQDNEIRLNIIRTYPEKVCMLVGDNFEIVLMSPMLVTSALKVNISLPLENQKLFSGMLCSTRMRIRKSEKKIRGSTLQNNIFAKQEVVGKQITPIAMKTKQFTLRNMCLKKKKITGLEVNNFDKNTSRKITIKGPDTMYSDSSMEEFMTFEQINYSLAPMYRYPNESFITSHRTTLPGIHRLNSNTPILK